MTGSVDCFLHWDPGKDRNAGTPPSPGVGVWGRANAYMTRKQLSVPGDPIKWSNWATLCFPWEDCVGAHVEESTEFGTYKSEGHLSLRVYWRWDNGLLILGLEIQAWPFLFWFSKGALEAFREKKPHAANKQLTLNPAPWQRMVHLCPKVPENQHSRHLPQKTNWKNNWTASLPTTQDHKTPVLEENSIWNSRFSFMICLSFSLKFSISFFFLFALFNLFLILPTFCF